ncbi:MAG: DinB family protein, partial [Trueperaceae bacterium]|nr:DinB family protein [Trueperaceae bacterium]
MTFKIEEALEILSRTPATLSALLSGLSDNWTKTNEGPETFSPYDVVGHLIEAEKNLWMVRANSILEYGETKPFTPFDRFAHYESSKGKSLETLLEEFAALRNDSLETLRDTAFTSEDLAKTGTHPEFGSVKLAELLATWVVHDLSHIRQIVRTMTKQYSEAVGPWKAYLSV